MAACIWNELNKY